jgi:hypothetical protein
MEVNNMFNNKKKKDRELGSFSSETLRSKQRSEKAKTDASNSVDIYESLFEDIYFM